MQAILVPGLQCNALMSAMQRHTLQKVGRQGLSAEQRGGVAHARLGPQGGRGACRATNWLPPDGSRPEPCGPAHEGCHVAAALRWARRMRCQRSLVTVPKGLLVMVKLWPRGPSCGSGITWLLWMLVLRHVQGDKECW